MGQPSIPILNKTGYSMFWNSMWDNKILYTRYLKENIFLETFFSLSFNDSISINTLNFKKKKIFFYKKYYLNLNLKKNSIYKHLFNINKVNYYSTKLWVLRYQNWIIIYNYLFMLNSSKNNSKIVNLKKENFFLFNYYEKINKKINYLYFLNLKTNTFNNF